MLWLIKVTNGAHSLANDFNFEINLFVLLWVESVYGFYWPCPHQLSSLWPVMKHRWGSKCLRGEHTFSAVVLSFRNLKSLPALGVYSSQNNGNIRVQRSSGQWTKILCGTHKIFTILYIVWWTPFILWFHLLKLPSSLEASSNKKGLANLTKMPLSLSLGSLKKSIC